MAASIIGIPVRPVHQALKKTSVLGVWGHLILAYAGLKGLLMLEGVSSEG